MQLIQVKVQQVCSVSGTENRTLHALRDSREVLVGAGVDASDLIEQDGVLIRLNLRDEAHHSGKTMMGRVL